jgi:hypothetical protein
VVAINPVTSSVIMTTSHLQNQELHICVLSVVFQDSLLQLHLTKITLHLQKLKTSKIGGKSNCKAPKTAAQGSTSAEDPHKAFHLLIPIRRNGIA